MASTLNSPLDCCTTCTDPVDVNVPGPQGADGADGTDGVDGTNAFAVVVGGLTIVPAWQGSVAVELAAPPGSKWMGLGQVVYVAGYGYYRVDALPDDTHATLFNLGSASDYAGNIDGNGIVTFAAGTRVSPGGLQGPAGADGAGGAPTDATYITQTTDLALPNSQALAGLGGGVMVSNNGTGAITNKALSTANGAIAPVDDAAGLTAGEAVFATASGIESKTAANARTALGLAIGTNVQAYSAFLAGLSAAGPGVADRVAYLTAANTWALTALTAAMRTLLGSASNAALLAALKVLPRVGLLGSLAGADMNSVLDQAITVTPSKYRVTGILVTNASVNLTTAQGGVYNAVGKPGGGILVAAGQVYTALTAATKFVDLTLTGVAVTDTQSAAFLYLSLSVAQGVAATADVYVFGQDLS